MVRRRRCRCCGGGNHDAVVERVVSARLYGADSTSRKIKCSLVLCDHRCVRCSGVAAAGASCGHEICGEATTLIDDHIL